VLRAEHGAEPVVVDLHELRAPHHQRREAGLQADARRGPEARGPRRDRAERRGGPVERPAAGRHLAGAREHGRHIRRGRGRRPSRPVAGVVAPARG
jgi:hypothetical protein